MQQGECDVTTYYNETMAVWQELVLFEEEKWKIHMTMLSTERRLKEV